MTRRDAYVAGGVTKRVLATGSIALVLAACSGLIALPPLPDDAGADAAPVDAALADAAVDALEAATPCTANALQCNGTIPQRCNLEGEWVSGTPCPFGCMNQQCAPECTAGDSQCVDGAYQECDSSGVWQAGVVVIGKCNAVCTPGGFVCGLLGGSPNPPAGACPLNSATCFWSWTDPGQVYQSVCDTTGQWDTTVCTDECTFEGGMAFSCQGGSCLTGGPCPEP
jgi:hypothetical protein